MPRTWFAREDAYRRDQEARPAPTPPQPADRELGLSDLSTTSNTLAAGAKAALLDQIAELLADAIFADVTGQSESLRSVPLGDGTVADRGESR